MQGRTEFDAVVTGQPACTGTAAPGKVLEFVDARHHGREFETNCGCHHLVDSLSRTAHHLGVKPFGVVSLDRASLCLTACHFGRVARAVEHVSKVCGAGAHGPEATVDAFHLAQ